MSKTRWPGYRHQPHQLEICHDILSTCCLVDRYQDSFDDVNNVIINVQNVSASSIESLGSPEKFLQDQAYLFGEQAAFKGAQGWLC